MKIVYFTHSLQSCWNHGNAHFLRGVLRDLVARGHDVTALEPADAWSLEKLLSDHGQGGQDAWQQAYPELCATTYTPNSDLAALTDGADLVIVHEWNEPALVAAIGKLRAYGAPFTLLFHDTHHRAVSDPQAIRAFDLSGYNGVLAFGEALSQVYRRWGWGDRVWTWHEAADLTLFHPPEQEVDRKGLVWVGNWGDGERSAELEEFLFRPAQAAGLPLTVHGVRYPVDARATLKHYGVDYRGWIANASAPALFAHYLTTVHVPRRPYTEMLPGIPTIRVFEALACGIPLVSAPWEDREHLFTPGADYLVARDGTEMTRHLRTIAADPELRQSLVEHGLATIRSRHSCTHRVDQLLAIVADLQSKEATQLQALPIKASA